MRLPACLLLSVLIVEARTAAALAQPPPLPPPARLFGTEDDPRPGLRPVGPPVVMRLLYARAAGAEACPDEQVFRDAVGSQVRRSDPFAPHAPWLLTVTISHRGGYEGVAELRDVTGAVVFSKTYPPTPRCLDALGDLARAIAFEIERPAIRDRAPQTAGGLSAPVPPPEDPAPVPPPPAPTTFALRLGVGTWMDLATAPRPAFGLSANVGFRAAWFSLDGELHWTPPAAASVASGSMVETSRILGALIPCGHAGWFAGCLLGELGQIRGSFSTPGGAASPDHLAGLFLAGGVRLAVEIPVVRDVLFVRLAADLLGARPVLFRYQTVITGQKPGIGAEQWESASFAGSLGAGLLASF